MLRLLPLFAALIVVSAPEAATAGDFTGFYAGVNAGYGWEKDQTKGTGSASLPHTLHGDDGVRSALPPSASAAAAALRRSGAERSGTGR